MRRHSERFVCVLFVLAILVTGSAANAYRRPGVTTIETVSSSGEQASYPNPIGTQRDSGASPGCPQNNTVRLAAMTPNGRFLAFVSSAPNLVSFDTNGICDVFLRDRKKGTTERVSIGSHGEQAIGAPSVDPNVDLFNSSAQVAISQDGKRIVFTSAAINLAPGDTDLHFDTFVHDMKTETTRLVSTYEDDPLRIDYMEDFIDTYGPAISGDGRYASFMAQYQGSNGLTGSHVYVKDLETGALDEIDNPPGPTSDVPLTGTYEWAWGASMTRDGNTLALTVSSQPGSEDLTHVQNVFLVNRGSAKTEFACFQPDGATGTNWAASAQGPSITPDGRYLLFQSGDAGWVPNDANRTSDEYVCDLRTGRVTRVTVTSTGGETSLSTGPANALSPDGRYVQFSGRPSDLPGLQWCFGSGVCTPPYDPDGTTIGETYLYDTHTGTRELLSLRTTEDDSAGCPEGTHMRSVAGPLSLKARFAAFWSCNSNTVDGDSNENWDLFVRDRGEDVFASPGDEESTFQPAPNEICIADEVCIPPLDYIDERDGKDDVSKALTELGANLYGVSIANRAESGDLFVRVELEKMPSVNGVPLQGTSLLYGLGFEAGGASYEIRAQRTPGPDFDPAGGASFGLFKKDAVTGPYTKVATLRGGYGTTGVEIVFALPLSEIGLEAGGRISNVTAFTGLGTYLSGATRILDKAVLTPN